MRLQMSVDCNLPTLNNFSKYIYTHTYDMCDYVNDVVTRTLTLVLKINLNTFSKIYSQPLKIDVCIFAFS